MLPNQQTKEFVDYVKYAHENSNQRVKLKVFGKSAFKKIFICTVLLILVVLKASAQSFDCEKANTDVEKRICALPELKLLDEKLADAYTELMKSISDKDERNALTQNQSEWLNGRNDQTGRLLIPYYERRTLQLKYIKAERESQNLCDFGKNLLESEGYRYNSLTKNQFFSKGALVDINNDGVEEYVSSFENKIMNDLTIFNKEAKNCLEQNFPEKNYECGDYIIRKFGYRWDNLEYTLLNYEDRNYLLLAGSSGASAAFQIIEFGKNMEYRIVCEYKKEATIKTVFSNDANFCDRATKNNEIKAIKSESLTTQELEKTKTKGTSSLFSRIYRKIDIDNDGKTEDVINNEELLLGNLPGILSVGYNYLFIINDYETFKDIPGYGRRHYLSNYFNILFDNDTYYIDMSYSDVSVPLRLAENKRRISKIIKDEEILICEFGQDMKYIPVKVSDRTWKSDRIGYDDESYYRN